MTKKSKRRKSTKRQKGLGEGSQEILKTLILIKAMKIITE